MSLGATAARRPLPEGRPDNEALPDAGIHKITQETTMKKVLMCLAAIGGLALAASSVFAADKTLALVVKGLDNPYFDLMHQGCERANKELHKEGYTCYYTGPATAADESAEVQIIDDLLTKGVAAMAISPANAPAVAEVLRRRNVPIPVITADADLLPKDASLRKSYVGTDNYELGVKLGEQLKADRKSTRLNSSHAIPSRMPSSA